MSTEPQGWQVPKTNWQPSDPVGVTDMNRIEGNVKAIETGSRTIDPAQAPSGNSGTLRQLLDWLANRIRAITGTANWYDAPPITLTLADAKFDGSSGHTHAGAPGDAPPVAKIADDAVTASGELVWHAGNSGRVITLQSDVRVTPATSPSICGLNFLWSSKFAAGLSVYFEAVIATAAITGSVYAYCDLYDRTAQTSVVILSHNGTLLTRKRSGPLALVDGHEYDVRIWTGQQGVDAKLSCSRLVLL